MTRVLGPLVSPFALERAARDLLLPEANLLHFYLDEVTRADRASEDDPVDRVERPRTVSIRERASRFADEQLPAIILVVPGTTGNPRRGGDGMYSATYALGCCAVVQSTGEDMARELASILAVAGAAVLMQNLPGADDRISNVRWDGDAFDEGSLEPDQRSRCIATRGLLVDVYDMVTDLGSPPLAVPDPPLGEPPADPGDLLTVESTEVTVTPVEEV